MVRESTLRQLESEVGDLLEQQGAAGASTDLDSYRDDPVGFIREVLDGEPWERQREIAEAVRDSPQVTVRSCHAAGKDWLAARLALWWTYARRGLVVLTGPTATQVEEILMRGEVREAFRRSGLPGELHVRALRPAGEGKAGVLAKTATGVSALTGFHETRVLFVITEAQDPEINHAWDAAFACTTGAEDRILTLGNPTEQAGRFYRAHRGGDWRSVKVAASDIPNVREGRTVVPGLLTREGADRFATEYGEESGFYRSRVLAEFPSESEEGLYRREWLETAAERWKKTEASDSEKPICALDPARFGPDASVLAIRRGPVLEELVTWEGRQDTMRTAERTLDALEDRGLVEENCALLVDEVGVGGGVLDRLREKGYGASGFNGGRQAHDSDRFFNRRAESYWRLRRLLERGEVALPDDEELFEELLALRWRPTPQGKVQLERKADLKGRLGRSPDKADAVSMAFGVVQRPTFERTFGGPEMGGFVT